MSMSSKADNRKLGSRSLPTRQRQGGGGSEDPLVLSPVNAGRLSPVTNGDGVATTEVMTMKRLRELEKRLGVDEEKVRACVYHCYKHVSESLYIETHYPLGARLLRLCAFTFQPYNVNENIPPPFGPFLPQVREVSGAERALANEMRVGISETHQVFVEVRASIDPI